MLPAGPGPLCWLRCSCPWCRRPSQACQQQGVAGGCHVPRQGQQLQQELDPQQGGLGRDLEEGWTGGERHMYAW